MAITPALRPLDLIGTGGALPAPRWVDFRVLAANTNEAFNVPTGSKFVLFSANGDFYVSYDGDAATVPAADVTDGSSNEINPTFRYIGDGITQLNLISGSAIKVSLAYYS